jgi:hypothetical protein
MMGLSVGGTGRKIPGVGRKRPTFNQTFSFLWQHRDSSQTLPVILRCDRMSRPWHGYSCVRCLVRSAPSNTSLLPSLFQGLLRC